MLDALEQRCMLALPLSGTVVDLDDTPDVSFITSGNDVIEIILSGGFIQVRNSSGTVVDQVSASGITGINVNSQGGNDFVRLGRADGSLMPTVPVTIRGGAGNDTLIGGKGNDQIFGDDGDDRLDGRAGGDRIDGGTGFDTADYGSRVRSINVSLTNSSTANDGTTLGDNSSPAQYNDNGSDNLVDIEAVLGSSNADYMVGNSSANWFDGGGGNDTMFGGGGIDSLIGGAGTDRGYGDDDADYFFMQDSLGDQFLGGLGTTYAQYDAALDTPAPVAVPLSQSLSTFSIESSLKVSSNGNGNGNGNGGGGGGGSSGSFVDVVLPSDLSNYNFTYLDKKTEKSIPAFLQNRFKALKADGSLVLSGTEQDDVVTISQSGTQVTVSVNGELYDYDLAQLTRITFDGLGGNDLIFADPGVSVPLVINGGAGNDTITGGAAGDSLKGGAGDDSILAGAGSDSIYGEDGNDLLAGEAGSDLLDGGAGDDSILGGSENDIAYGGIGNDSLVGGDGDDSLYGEDGNDTLLGDAGSDSLDGGAGNDSLDGAAGNDEMHGGMGIDSLWGREGDDTLLGEDGDDILIGDAGLDLLNGGAGRDIMIGGLDADSLAGGDGDDLLIPGYTSYDNDVNALNWMASEWTRTDKAYTNRIANLNGGGTGSGNNITYYLRPGTGSSKTVFDDGAVDTLVGGNDMDYFFVSQKDGVDLLIDRQAGENITQL